MKTFIGAIAVVGLLWFGMSTASAWKCNVHPEKPNCTTTTVPDTTTTTSTTVPETTTTTSTVPETTTTTTSTTVPELAPPVTVIRLAG